MLINIQSFFLDASINTQADGVLQSIEERETTSRCPEVNDEDTECLSSEEAEAVPVEGAV